MVGVCPCTQDRRRFLVACQQAFNLGSGHRLGVQVALRVGAPHVVQQVTLRNCLNAFGHDIKVQILSEVDDRAHNVASFAAVENFVYK